MAGGMSMRDTIRKREKPQKFFGTINFTKRYTKKPQNRQWTKERPLQEPNLDQYAKG